MDIRLASFVVLAAALGGCALHEITTLHETFPVENEVTLACRTYYHGEDFETISKDIEVQRKAGWKVKLTGHEHSDIVVCFEKPVRQGTSPTLAPEGEVPPT